MSRLLQLSTRKKIGLVIGLILLVAAIGFIQWATYARPPLPEAVDALASDGDVLVGFNQWLTFAPFVADIPIDTGFIFYPGGRINPQGYAVLLREIAEQGYLVVTPEMPINMAVFNPDVADAIIAEHPEITTWVIGGHSVGGTVAAQYTKYHLDTIAGLVIWASYPADDVDLSDVSIPVALIYGTLDPRVNDESVDGRTQLLPEDTLYARIEGGDHHQFGDYLINDDEHHATLDRDAQQAQIIAATLEILEAASN